MKIIYDDLYEFSQAAIRCNDTVKKGKCMWCPFYDRCQIDSEEDRHIQCGEVVGKAGESNNEKKLNALCCR